MGVRIALVGAGRGGCALLELLLGEPGFQVAVVADRDATAPGLALARERGIPVVMRAEDVFAHPVELVLEVTGRPEVLAALRAAAPPGVEVIGATTARVIWDLVERRRLQHVQALEEATRVSRAFESLAYITQSIISSLDSDQVFHAMTAGAVDVLGADAATFSVFDETRQMLAVRADVGFHSPEGRATQVWRLGEGLVGWVGQQLQPEFVPDFPADPRARNKAWAREEGLLACGAIPLLAGERRLVGVLVVFYRRPHAFTTDEMKLFTALGGLAAVAIENARLYTDLQRALDALRASQERQIELERLRALGEMASGVAHHFNNMLAAILGRTQLMQPLTADPKIRQGLETIERLAQGGAQVVRRIQEFTRVRRRRTPREVRLQEVVADALEFTRGRWETEAQSAGHAYRIEADLGAAPPVLGTAAELREALVNILMNALDAMPEGGHLRISAGAEGDRVELRVADSGGGMPDEVRRRALEPFFTTKGPKSSGLGLAVAYGVVERHGGSLTIESEPGRGTTVILTLLAAPAAGRGLMPAGAAPPPLRVLVVEDEDDVRQVIVDALTEWGHEVLVAKDGSEGVRLANGGDFDLVLTDLSLPGRSGWAVAEAVRARGRDVPIVFVTGWGENVDPARLAGLGRVEIASKPFRLEDLAALVARLVD